MNRNNFKQYIAQVSKFPAWMKAVIVGEISGGSELNQDISYIFTTYKPLLTYKGSIELSSKNTGFDTNIYNILELIAKDYTISEISLDTYLNLEEVSSYFIMCVNSGYVEFPEDVRILNVANFLSGKCRLGECLSSCKQITPEQLEQAVEVDNNLKQNRKFGKILSDLGFVKEQDLMSLVTLKEDSKKRFILDYNEVPSGTMVYSKITDKYASKIEDLQMENRNLKSKLNLLLTMVRAND